MIIVRSAYPYPRPAYVKRMTRAYYQYTTYNAAGDVCSAYLKTRAPTASRARRRGDDVPTSYYRFFRGRGSKSIRRAPVLRMHWIYDRSDGGGSVRERT